MDNQPKPDQRNAKKYLIDLLLNFAIIYIAYVLAVSIRYYLFTPQYAVYPFSLPFLIIILIYSAIMAVSLDYEEFPRLLQGNEISSGIYQIVSKNVIGCLVLSSVFFATGIVNFSRWALFLFCFFSCIGLIIKRITLYSATARRRCTGEDVRNVAIVGEGQLAVDYINAIANNPQFGIKIIGYYGPDNLLQTDLKGWFEQEKYPFPIIRRLGEYDAERIKNNRDIDEIIVTELKDTKVSDIVNELISAGKKVSISLPYSRYISHGTVTRDLGNAKLVKTGENTEKKKYAKTGLLVSVALLLIILLIKRFGLSSMDTVYTIDGIEKMRSTLFAVSGYFFSWIISDKLTGKRHGMINSAVISLAFSTAAIMIYELAYQGSFWQNVMVDMIPTFVVIVLYFGLKKAIRVFAQSFVGA